MKTMWMLGLLPLAACTMPERPKPAITEISDSSVSVLQRYGATNEAVALEAVRGCGLYGKKPVPVSSRCAGPDSCLSTVHLFACTAE
jgi:hypothetical protein